MCHIVLAFILKFLHTFVLNVQRGSMPQVFFPSILFRYYFSNVHSPSFQKKLRVCHMVLELEEELRSKNNFCFIQWPKKTNIKM
jgi:hypothetical protein